APYPHQTQQPPNNASLRQPQHNPPIRAPHPHDDPDPPPQRPRHVVRPAQARDEVLQGPDVLGARLRRVPHRAAHRPVQPAGRHGGAGGRRHRRRGAHGGPGADFHERQGEGDGGGEGP
ncbi:hypothetical protein LTR16_008693, partial [Cryomyces antarcticus]